MLEKINNIIENLKNINLKKDKIEFLSKYKNDIDIRRFFRYCYDENFNFGVSSELLKKNIKLLEFEFFDDFFELCDLILTKKITGKKVIALINGYINSNDEYKELLYNFFDKNLKIGLSISQLNIIFNNLIPIFNIVEAVFYEEEKHKFYQLEKYFIQRKMDGLRLITFIDYNYGNVNIIFKSKKGKVLTSLIALENELKEIYKNSIYFGNDIVLDGEACIIDENGKENWNRIISEVKRKNHIIYNPKYVCFDILSKDEFFGRKKSMKYSVRYNNLKKFLSSNIKYEHISMVFSVSYTIQHFEKLSQEYINSDLWDGFIFRKDSPYTVGKTTDLLKYKMFKEADCVVSDVEYGNRMIFNIETDKAEDMHCIESLIIEYKGNIIKVSAGISDEQRIDWYTHPEWIIGKQITIKYKDEIVNSNGTISLGFLMLKNVCDTHKEF